MYKLLLKYNYHFNIQNHSFQLLYLYILFYISFIYKSEPIQKRLSQIKIQLNLYYSFPLPKATFHFWRSQTFHLTAGDSSPLRSKPFPSPQVTLHLWQSQTITSPQVTFHFWQSQTITSPQVTFHLWRSQTITSPQVTLHLWRSQTITSPQVTFHFWRSQTITSPQVTFHLDVVD